MWPWLPTLLVIVVTAMALTGAGSPPAGASARRAWTAGLMLCGFLAIAGTVWQAQQRAGNPAQGERGEPAATDRARQIKALEERIGELQAARQGRTIAPETAERLTTYLRGFAARRVIVSCIPDDLEAYRYANQLAKILKAADWEAQGPEVTKIFGDVRSPAINFYVNAEDHSDTAKILVGAFDRFNIPYQSRVTPSQAIPDAETVELFIGSMRSG